MKLVNKEMGFYFDGVFNFETGQLIHMLSLNLQAWKYFTLDNLKLPKSRNKDCEWKSIVKRKVLIRKIEDIALLIEEDYGLPSVSNFA